MSTEIFHADPYTVFLSMKLQLIEKYASLISRNNTGICFTPGTSSFIEEIFEAMKASGDDKIRVHSIVTVGGRVAVYYEGGDDNLWKTIARISFMSSQVCDVCGQPKSKSFPTMNRCAEHADFRWQNDAQEIWDAYDKRLKQISKGFRAEAD